MRHRVPVEGSDERAQSSHRAQIRGGGQVDEGYSSACIFTFKNMRNQMFKEFREQFKSNSLALNSWRRNWRTTGLEMEGDTYSGLNNGMTQVDPKVLQSFQMSFVQVQSILDQNRLLINEINQNHESKIPVNLSRNVSLIRELNNNIRRVVDLYAHLSTLFAKSMESSSNLISLGRSVADEQKSGIHKLSKAAFEDANFLDDGDIKWFFRTSNQLHFDVVSSPDRCNYL